MTSPNAGHSAGQLETRGIEPVPENECNGDPLQLFWVWFAANISILGLPLGATLVAFHQLAIWQVVIVALIGAAGSFAVVGVISIAGRRGRAPSLTLSRAIFGVRGNIGPTLVSLISRVGWETVNTTTAAFVLLALSSIVFNTPAEAKHAPWLTLLCIGIFTVLTLCVSGLGHATLLLIQKWATYVFGALNLLVGGFLCATIDWQTVFSASPAPLSAVIIGIGIMAAGTGIGWANAGADMSRYQKRSVRASQLIASAAWGAGIPLVLLISLGGLLSVGNHDLASATDPIAAIRNMLPSWMAVPYLLSAFGGLLLSNHLSVYSAGLTTLTLGGEHQTGTGRRRRYRGNFLWLDLLHAVCWQLLWPLHYLYLTHRHSDYRLGGHLCRRPCSPPVLQRQRPAGRQRKQRLLVQRRHRMESIGCLGTGPGAGVLLYPCGQQ